MKRRMVTDEVVAREVAAGRTRIAAPAASAIITPAAWSKARELGVVIDQGPHADGDAARVVDASGVMVVRGGSVQLGRFTGAGPDRNVGLTDLVTARHGSPMTAGVMAWSREDSFAWSLDYDEIDLVLEGVLSIEIDGRKLEGGVGDVFYIPKGSSIVFGTPSRTRVFYVTYPADWAVTRA